jgi:predicted ATPase with chaperone activity
MMLRITQKPSQKSLNLPLQHFPSNYRFHIWDTLVFSALHTEICRMKQLCHQICVLRMHGCPCGYHTDPAKECRCTPGQIQKYMSKISGPLLDRIDIHVEVPAVKYKDLAGEITGESSYEIRQRVDRARQVQQQRLTGEKIHCNASM